MKNFFLILKDKVMNCEAPSILESVFGRLSSSVLGPGVEQSAAACVGEGGVFVSFCPGLTSREAFIGSHR